MPSDSSEDRLPAVDASPLPAPFQFPRVPKRLVVKMGTGILRARDGTADRHRMAGVAQVAARLMTSGIEVILVSSGAVGMGMGRLGRERRPTELDKLQACAAVGQPILMQAWREAFATHKLDTAQILLTHEDVRSQHRHLAAIHTLERLLRWGIVPIVNENDTVSTAEIQFGDNDSLSACVASLLDADILAILSTIPGLLDLGKGACLIPRVESLTPEIEALAQGTNNPAAVGGMISKLRASAIATRSGCTVFIGSGQDPAILEDVVRGQARGTYFSPAPEPLKQSKRRIAFFEKPAGVLLVDAGAEAALRAGGRSLLAKGVLGLRGQFSSGAVVELCGPANIPFARGMVSFSSDEIARIAGASTSDIQALFPGRRHYELIHCDALALLQPNS